MNVPDKQLSLDFGEGMLSDHPRTMKELAAYYGVGHRVVRRWMRNNGLADLARRRGTGQGYYYTIAELRRIAQVLGE